MARNAHKLKAEEYRKYAAELGASIRLLKGRKGVSAADLQTLRTGLRWFRRRAREETEAARLELDLARSYAAWRQAQTKPVHETTVSHPTPITEDMRTRILEFEKQHPKVEMKSELRDGVFILTLGSTNDHDIILARVFLT